MELLLQRIERMAAEGPERAAILETDRSLTYGDMLENVRRLSDGFAASGIGMSDIVAIALPNSIEFVLSHLALMRLGAITAPVHPQQLPRDLAMRIAEVSPRAVITTADLMRSFTESDFSALRIVVGGKADGTVPFSELLVPRAESMLPREITDLDLAAVVWTAGVSGTPRAVELTHLNFAHQAHLIGRSLRVKPKDRISGTHSFANIFGLTLGVHLSLAHGASICIFGMEKDVDYAAALNEHQVSVLIGSPRTYTSWARSDSIRQAELPNLRYLICCDGRLSPDICRTVEDSVKRPVLCNYGATETCGLIALNLFPVEEDRTIEGEPLGDTEIAILDEQGKRLGAGKVGRIAVRGMGVMPGYHNQPERTREVMNDDWFVTDDFGALDYQGRLSVKGHVSACITKGGFPVYAWEVEEVLRSHPAVKDVAIVGVADSVYGTELKACLVSNNGTMVATGELIDYLKARLPIYKCPRTIRFYKELPHTPGGKIKRGLLREDRL